jgi:hypothetical protein
VRPISEFTIIKLQLVDAATGRRRATDRGGGRRGELAVSSSCNIDARSNKVVVTTSTKLDPSILVVKLRRSGKQAELWPEQPPLVERTQMTNFKKRSMLWLEQTKN